MYAPTIGRPVCTAHRNFPGPPPCGTSAGPTTLRIANRTYERSNGSSPIMTYCHEGLLVMKVFDQTIKLAKQSQQRLRYRNNRMIAVLAYLQDADIGIWRQA